MHSLLADHRNDIFETFFESANFCIVIVDQQGFISYMNDNYCEFLKVNKEEVNGKHVTEVIENTRMHVVTDTGKEEIADLQYIRGNYMIASRIPLRSDGKIVGALGMVLFRDTEEWLKMNSHIKNLLLELKAYDSHISNQNGATYTLHDIVSASPQVNLLKGNIKKIAPTNVSILIRGESGTGKELVAHSIHHLSERSTKPFVKVNCAAIPEHLLESELFGYQEGAFTGAKKGGKPGKFQLANGGTLFLDEIGDMPLSAQVKILRVLQEGEVEAVGAVQPQKVDVRIIASTHQPLEELIAEKKFREDLFYRINVVPITIPSLRERKEDIEVLANYFITQVTERTGKRVTGFEPTTLTKLKHYHWPGNVRELQNAIEASVHLTDTEKIKLADLPDTIQLKDVQEESLKDTVEQAEKQAIRRALQKADGDKAIAATSLGIGKSSFYEKVKKYNL